MSELEVLIRESSLESSHVLHISFDNTSSNSEASHTSTIKLSSNEGSSGGSIAEGHEVLSKVGGVVMVQFELKFSNGVSVS